MRAMRRRQHRHRIAYDSSRRRPSRCAINRRSPPASVLAAVLLALLSGGVRGARSRYLPPEVEQASTHEACRATRSASSCARSIATSRCVSYNSTVPRNPASTMKVLTTYRGARDRSAPLHVAHARVRHRARPRQVLEGDLVLVGGGDPFMTTERWWAFVDGMRQAGIVEDPRRRRDRQYAVRPAGRRPRAVRQPSVSHLQRAARCAAGQFPDRRHRGHSGRGDAAPCAPARSPGPRTSRSRTVCVSIRARALPARWRRRGDARRATGNRISLSGRYARGLRSITVTRAVMRRRTMRSDLFQTFWQQSGGSSAAACVSGRCRRSAS